MGGHASADWVDFIPTVTAWRWSTINRSLGMCPYEAFFCRKPQFAYDRLGPSEVCSVTPNELANICACIDVLVSTASAVSSARVAAQYDKERDSPPRFSPGDTVSVYFPDREHKLLTHYRGPFRIIAQADAHGNYYHVQDAVQLNRYEVHVERIKPFDMTRTTLEEQAQRQLPSRDFGIVVGVDTHRMNDAHGLYEFLVRFYSGYRAWQLFPHCQNLDVVKAYVAEHKLNTRKQTPQSQFTRLTGKSPVPAADRPTPNRTGKSAQPTRSKQSFRT
jgi:hypothetical protein